ncbi:hypothetical protein Kpol_1043p70 [Vanderwaltozyma polyspora DSM 70294]|uniref:NUA/TPR/MLP1-2-like domain-containing protein n=1 Tax=Vanderwaltozyma polyspora (strain ATCC 22028 / DSM 70294 / BCRC 21397 / CBS 2163 / NBRC 10782 / NRRL Y-8283 / UCD 57-17) TaxID=436907 RepID=A7TIT7_VANPO|nr:uncharacterized protein Kpol_1043p70 [Vanderwaltozyma polyspora DSM 70294]EDO17879.1 hypothetical protein Kpol_1043p70 [Vanderwaltozyma polyspora DSM 70294]
MLDNTLLQDLSLRYHIPIDQLNLLNETSIDQLLNYNENSDTESFKDKFKIDNLNLQIQHINNDNLKLSNQLKNIIEKFNLSKIDQNKTIENLKLKLFKLENENKTLNSTNLNLTDKNDTLNNNLNLKLIELKNLNDNITELELKRNNDIQLKDKLIQQLNSKIENLLKLGKSPKFKNEVEIINDSKTINDDIENSKATIPPSPAKALSKQNNGLKSDIQNYLNELEQQLPLIENFKAEIENLQDNLNKKNLIIESLQNDKKENLKLMDSMKKTINEKSSSIEALDIQRTDLAHQLQYLLIHSSIQNDNNGPLSKSEILFMQNLINKDKQRLSSDVQSVISDRLIKFKDIVSLQEKNMELTKSIRNLAFSLESKESEIKNSRENYDNDTINEAKETILSLQEYNNVLKLEIGTLQSKISELQSSIPNSKESEKQHFNYHSNLVKDLESKLSKLSAYSQSTIENLNKDIQNLYNERTDILINLEKEKSSTILANEKLTLLQNSYDLLTLENEELSSKNSMLEQQLNEEEKNLNSVLNDYIKCKTNLLDFTNRLTLLNNNKLGLEEENNSLKQEIKSNYEQIKDLDSKSKHLEQSLENEISKYTDKVKELELNISKLNEQKLILERKLQNKNIEIDDLNSSNYDQISWYQKKLDQYEKTIKTLESRLPADTQNSKALVEDKALEDSRDASPVSSSASCNEITIRIFGDSNKTKKIYPIEEEKNLELITKELEDTKVRVQNLATQNRLLLEKLERSANLEVDDIFVSLRYERDTLSDQVVNYEKDMQVILADLESVQSELNAANSQILNFENQRAMVQDHKKGNVNEETLIEKLTELDELKERNMELTQEIHALNENNIALKCQLEESLERLKPLETKISELNILIEDKDNIINVSNEKAENWKTRFNELTLSAKNNDNEDLINLQKQVEEKSKENEELSDRFNRLKKQANERLHASKVAQNNLTEQSNELKARNTDLERNLSEQMERFKELENSISLKDQELGSIGDLKEQLANALDKSKKFEEELIKTVSESESLVSDLKNEIESLNEKLKSKESSVGLQESEIENAKKILIAELEEKLNKTKSELDLKHKEELKVLKTEYEGDIQKRVAEAEEALKRKIRLPSEEKINTIIESKVADLEEDYKKKLETVSAESTDIEKIKQEFEDNLVNAKKKAFEEGKQQASMKTKFLENKIAKLESQLQNNESDVTDKEAEVKTTDNEKSNPELDKQEAKPSFTFSPPPNSNPFTTTQDTDSPVSVFGIKPTFSLGANPFKISPVAPSFQTARADSSQESKSDDSNSNSESPKRHSEDENEQDLKKFKPN